RLPFEHAVDQPDDAEGNPHGCPPTNRPGIVETGRETAASTPVLRTGGPVGHRRIGLVGPHGRADRTSFAATIPAPRWTSPPVRPRSSGGHGLGAPPWIPRTPRTPHQGVTVLVSIISG